MNKPLDSVTFIGSPTMVLQASVTRKYEDWELPFLNGIDRKRHNRLCRRCGLEIVGQPSNIFLGEGVRMLYSPTGTVCYPCTREASRVRRLRVRQENRNKVCSQCGVHFVATRADAKYCSAGCKQKHHRSLKVSVNNNQST